MERDNAREAWALLETHLRRTERLNDVLVAQSMEQKTQTRLMGERRFVLFEIALNYAAVVALGAFAFDHRVRIVVLVSAAILAAALVAINVVLIGIAVALSGVDYDEPVLAVQSTLERIKMRRAGLTATVLFASALLWTPLLVVLLSLAGARDTMRILGMPYLAANVVLGVLVVAAAWLSARYFRLRPDGSRWVARAADVLTGNAYRDAQEFLDTIERFREAA